MVCLVLFLKIPIAVKGRNRHELEHFSETVQASSFVKRAVSKKSNNKSQYQGVKKPTLMTC